MGSAGVQIVGFRDSAHFQAKASRARLQRQQSRGAHWPRVLRNIAMMCERSMASSDSSSEPAATGVAHGLAAIVHHPKMRTSPWSSATATVIVSAGNANVYRRVHYQFWDIDIILLEGIVLKREYQHRHDVSLWIDCRLRNRITARG
jgi:hypothetical protein